MRTEINAKAGRLLLILCIFAAFACLPRCIQAQGAPPHLTNDPGTPGNANWEINIGAVPTIRRDSASYQLPQIDVNFGVGDRLQLTYEIPYVVQTERDQPRQTGWSNANPGMKWRFLDHGDRGWQLSTFPQLETAGSKLAQRSGIAIQGPRLLLPLEIRKSVGPINFGFEGGYFVPWHGPEERILGFVAGHSLTQHLDLSGEIYNDRAMGALPHDTTFDVGGHYEFHRGLILLFMAGRSFSGNSSGQPEFMGYFGIQVLLSKYGRTLTPDE